MAIVSANNNSLSAITALPTAVSGGGFNLISTQTASSSSTISFTSGIDSTYKEYIFKFINIHPSEAEHFTFQASTNSGSSYGVTITSTYFHATHDEGDTSTALSYVAGKDLAQSTSYLRLADSLSTSADESSSGTLHLFDPSNTTFVKHFISDIHEHQGSNYAVRKFLSGYANTTSAINAIDFKFASGNIDSGVIKLYGVS